MNRIEEVWRGLEGILYSVSNYGNVKNNISGRILRGCTRNGYHSVGLQVNKKQIMRYVHRLVAEMFLGPCPLNFEVNHKDGNRKNNSVLNLEYVTHRGNMLAAVKLGSVKSGERSKLAKLKWADVCEIRRAYSFQESVNSIAKRFNATVGNIRHIVYRHTWKTQ